MNAKAEEKNMKQTSKNWLKNQGYGLIKTLVVFSIFAGCTKNRKAELDETTSEQVFEISMFGEPTANSSFEIQKTESNGKADSQLKAIDASDAARLSENEVQVPSRIKFMFEQLPMTSQADQQFKVTFTVDQNNVIAYKVAPNVATLNPIEKSLAISLKEAQLTVKKSRSKSQEFKKIAQEFKQASQEREQIKSGQATGTLLVPLFSYKVAAKGILQKVKNELKEETSKLELKETSWDSATHIKLDPKKEARQTMGLEMTVLENFRKEFYDQSKLDLRTTTAKDLESVLKIGLRFLKPETQILTKLSAGELLVYEITDLSKLDANQKRVYLAGGAAGRIVSCQEASVQTAIKSNDKNCVIVLAAKVPVAYKKVELNLVDANGLGASTVQTVDVPKSQSVGLVEIKENTAAQQVEITQGLLDPDYAVKISDLQGEFMFRRTFEDAASSFLGRTGTSGDAVFVKFELEDDRLVARNTQALIQYQGQTAKDREEVLSIPVRYFRVMNADAFGSELVLGQAVETTKEKANYIILDWTSNRIPDAFSPLGLFDAGSCFISTAQDKITNTDMRLAKDGVLNFSIQRSHSVDYGCAAQKETNSAYWAGSAQTNFNLTERLSFVRRKTETDRQNTLNISHMAQEAFNFGMFTQADLVKKDGVFNNRDGSEKYMPMIHDLTNGKKMRWYLGGINNPTATSPERRQLLVDATKQVIEEWNSTFRYAFRGTQLDRTEDYIELVIEEPGKETGRLGDLDRNYIWLNEIPADNGLLGVAQPAANPRTGTIESANVIVYTGNTFDQSDAWMMMTKVARDYEKMIEKKKQEFILEAQKQKTIVQKDSSAQSKAKADGASQKVTQKVQGLSSFNNNYMKSLVKFLDLDQQKMKKKINNLTMTRLTNEERRRLTKANLTNQLKAGKIELPLDQLGLTEDVKITQKIMKLVGSKELAFNDHELELKINEIFMKDANLPAEAKAMLAKRQQVLAMTVRFDRATKNRPGCFRYSRNEINDAALPDENLTGEAYAAAYKEKLLHNFKQAVMTTLSHELGHAFGLMHNFKASTDAKNFEFPEDVAANKLTGRNYSSVMDYMNDIEQHYAGPGPYDAHAIRAAYTGYVELDESILKSATHLSAMKEKKLKLINKKFIHINDLMNLLGENSFVHFRKETLNTVGVLKHYEQCSDGGTYESIMCNRFDLGGTATEIVKNNIRDYHRNYIVRNYVHDRINFGWAEKIQLLQRNIGVFSEIRSFLDETINVAIYGSGRPEEAHKAIMNDLVSATLEGYKFFHEVIRTPESETGFTDFDSRFVAVPYQYEKRSQNAQGQAQSETVNDVKIIEKRSLYDVAMTRNKIDTMGIGYDKYFALNFLMQTTTPMTTDDSQMGFITYKEFEQFFLGVTDPSQSLTIQTMLGIFSDKLNAGFFDPNGALVQVELPVKINQQLADQAAISALIGLSESRWKSNDPFAETFKMARAYARNAPKDRQTIARIGHDRTKDDTIVYFAPQNAVGAEVLVRQAGLADIFVSNKTNLFKTYSELAAAEEKHLTAYYAARAEACKTNANGEMLDKAKCEQESKKSVAEFVAQNPQLASSKKAADQVANKLVQQLRELNKFGVIMGHDMDQPDQKMNFKNQVEVVRILMGEQMNLVSRLKSLLETTEVQNLGATIETIIKILQENKKSNDELATIPLFAFTQSYLVDWSKNVSISLKTGEQLAATELTTNMMEADRLSQSNERIMDMITKLTNFTRYVDQDFATTR